MNKESIQEKKPDEIYCPSCAKPIKKDAVVCPYCGVQVKELKVSAEVKPMTPEQELEEGRRQLGGIKVYYWFAIVVLAIYLFVFAPLLIASDDTLSIEYGVSALYIIPLVGIIKRKSFSVPFTRVMLILTMFGFPLGTIIGAVLWQRINHPLAKKYLHYGV